MMAAIILAALALFTAGAWMALSGHRPDRLWTALLIGACMGWALPLEGLVLASICLLIIAGRADRSDASTAWQVRR